MKGNAWVLLKRQLDERLSIFKKDRKNLDIVGALITLTFVALLIIVVVTVFSQFVEKYSAVRINRVTDVAARQFELMTLVYEVVFIVGVLSAIGGINKQIFESDDRIILMSLPIKSSTVFITKFITVYFREVAVCLVILLPFNLTFSAVTQQSAYFVIMSVLSCVFLPVIIIATASLFSMPYYFVKRFVSNKYLTLLISVTVVLGLVFWCYAEVLDFVKTLMTTGEIKFFFSESTMNTIIKTTTYLYPANLLANILLKNALGKNIGIFMAMVVGEGIIALLIVGAMFNRAVKLRATDSGRLMFAPRDKVGRPSSRMVALLKKELIGIIRTPSYAVQYLTIAAIMPLSVYFCMGIGHDLISTLLFTDADLEIALFLTAMFAALTNTFCATNISRDGETFAVLKTMPFTPTEIMGTKILFSSIVSTVATAVTVIVITAVGYTTAGEGAVVFFVVWTLAEAQICFATRKDLNRPAFSAGDDEVRESNANVSTVVATGLMLSVVVGGIPLIYRMVFNLRGGGVEYFTPLFALLMALFTIVCSLAYLFIGLERRFSRITEAG